MTSFQR